MYDPNSLTISVTGTQPGTYTATATFDTNGSSFTLVPYTDWPEDTYTITATIADVLGNMSALATWHVKVDRTLPAIQFVTPFADSTVTIPDPIFSGTITDFGSGIDVSKTTFTLNGSAALSANFHDSVLLPLFAGTSYSSGNAVDFRAWQTNGSLIAGPNVITITAVDFAGNSFTYTQNFVVDYSLPYGFGDEEQLFAINTPVGSATVLKVTSGGSDETNNPCGYIYYSIGDTPSEGALCIVPSGMLENGYDIYSDIYICSDNSYLSSDDILTVYDNHTATTVASQIEMANNHPTGATLRILNHAIIMTPVE